MKKLIGLSLLSLSLLSSCGTTPYPMGGYGYMPQQTYNTYQRPLQAQQSGYVVRQGPSYQAGARGISTFSNTASQDQISIQPVLNNPDTPVPTGRIADEYEVGHILIGLYRAEDFPKAKQVIAQQGLKMKRFISGINTLVVDTAGKNVPELIATLSQHSIFAFVESNALGKSRYESEAEANNGFTIFSESAYNDPDYDAQYALRILDAEKAWEVTRGEGVVVSIIDSGVELSHHDLKNRIVPGYDAYSDDDAVDSGDASAMNHINAAYKHGTHVAGIVSAEANNNKSIVGMAPESKVMPVKIFPDIKDFFVTNRERDEDNKVTTAAILSDGIVWSVDHGADIINMSLIMTFESETIQRAIDYANEHNVTVIVSAGNYRHQDNRRNTLAAYNGVIGVGATDKENKITYFSNSGDYVSVVAPGKDIVSTIPALLSRSKSKLMSGTSMAAPYVAGVAALLKSKYGDLATPSWIKARLENTALDLGDPGRDDLYGHGLINAYRALTDGGDSSETETPTE